VLAWAKTDAIVGSDQGHRVDYEAARLSSGQGQRIGMVASHPGWLGLVSVNARRGVVHWRMTHRRSRSGC
jgi:hypothetical protein